MQNLLNEHQHPITKALAEVGQKASKIPTLSLSLWNADTCPEHLLPYLAWACSVDFWRETWPAEKKRRVIKNSREVHAHKGTSGAIALALTPFVESLRLIPWHKMQPIGRRGTFAIELTPLATGLSKQDEADIFYLLDETKRASQHLAQLRVTQNTEPIVFGLANLGQGHVSLRAEGNLKPLPQFGQTHLSVGVFESSTAAALTGNGALQRPTLNTQMALGSAETSGSAAQLVTKGELKKWQL